MPRSRATARSDRLAAPPSARWRRAVDLISSVISARTRSRSRRGVEGGVDAGVGAGAGAEVGEDEERGEAATDPVLQSAALDMKRRSEEHRTETRAVLSTRRR